VRFFLGSGVGSVSWREWVGSKMGLFQNGKDNWVGVSSRFIGGLVLVEFYIGNCWVVDLRLLDRVIAWMSRDLGNEFQFGT
jgi:hypothetical protein